MVLSLEDFKGDFRFKKPHLKNEFVFKVDKAFSHTNEVGHLEYDDKHFANVEIIDGKVLFYSSKNGLSYSGNIDLEKFEKIS